MNQMTNVPMNIDQEDMQMLQDGERIAQVFDILAKTSMADELVHFRPALNADVGLELDSDFLNFETFSGFLRYMMEKLNKKPEKTRMYRGRPLAEVKKELETRNEVRQHLITSSETLRIPSSTEETVCSPRFNSFQPTEQRKRERRERRERMSQSDEEESKHLVIKALSKLMQSVNVPLKGMSFDTDEYEKAVLLFGNTKPHRKALKQIGGNWNGRLKAWIFSKNKVIETANETEEPKSVPETDTATHVVEENSDSSDSSSDDDDQLEEEVDSSSSESD